MPRFVALFASVALMALATNLLLTGCNTSSGAIHTAPMPSSATHLTPNPPHIYLAPFDTSTGKWLVGRDGSELSNFKSDFQTNFLHQLQTRLTKIAPTDERWVDEMPDHGWLVTGEFNTVYQGSRALRSVVGSGMGETTFQTTVYVYDLEISKTQYILSFRTGVPDATGNTGAGSGSLPSGVTGPLLTPMGVGSGLKLDTTRTCREILAILEQYAQ